MSQLLFLYSTFNFYPFRRPQCVPVTTTRHLRSKTLASVPFKWEEKPGKPRPCTDITPIPGPRKPLEPPPCRLQLPKDPSNGSPTTVLDGPDTVGRPRFSSFRLYRESFDGSAGGDSPQSSADVLVRDGGSRSRRGFLGRGLKRNGSVSSLSQLFPRLCASIYQRLKQAVPWKSAKRK